jgi:DNA-binding response OmpR family regulator
LDCACAMRILVVDDEPSVLESISQLLQLDQHAVTTAADAVEALVKFDSTEFDFALVDLRLPGMQGDELAREMHRRRAGVPVVLMAGTPVPKPLPGTALVLQKPFSIKELRDAIAQFSPSPEAQENPLAG